MITFNTAVGNPKIRTPQAAFPDLPFYQEILSGKPDAPILCAQEVGPDQVAEIRKRAAGTGVHISYARPRPWQGNMILIPDRFEVLSERSETFKGSHVTGVVASLWAALRGKHKPNVGQWFEPRSYTELLLKDKASGRQLTVINTHLSLDPDVRKRQAADLARIVDKAKERGPVILAGDLNTRTAAGDQAGGRQGEADAAIRKTLEGRLKDAGPDAPPGRRRNIDWVMVDGLVPAGGRYHTGKDLQLPGSPDAESVSDHYAEEDVLAWP